MHAASQRSEWPWPNTSKEKSSFGGSRKKWELMMQQPRRGWKRHWKPCIRCSSLAKGCPCPDLAASIWTGGARARRLNSILGRSCEPCLGGPQSTRGSCKRPSPRIEGNGRPVVTCVVRAVGVSMAKRKLPPKMWVYAPRSAPKAKVPEAVKTEVSQQGRRLIDELKSRYIKEAPPKGSRFNY